MFDPSDPGFLADPYPVFAGLREQGPVHRHDGLGLFVAVGHAACSDLLRSRDLGRIWQDREPVEVFPAFNLLHQTSILESEPPTHTRLRRLVASAFGRGHVERMRPWIDEVSQRLVAGLVEQMRDGEPADLISSVAEPLPVEVIAELLGVPVSDRKLLRPWSNAIVKMYEYGLDPRLQAEAEAAAAEFVAYLRELVDERRVTPGSDLISDLVAAAGEGDRLSRDEIVGTCVLLLMAGHEATVNVLGNGILALAHRPGEWDRVVRDPGLVDSTVEEMLRFDSSLQLFERTATQEVVIAGTTVPEGAKVAALLGAANRDPALFADPDRFDAARTPNAHLGFGAGIHFCLGAPLARVELQTVLAALTRALPTLTLREEPRRRPEFVIRGLTDLQLVT